MGYEQRVGKAYTRGARLTCAVFIVGLVLGVAMVTTLLWVIGGRDAGANGYRPLYALTVPLFFMGALGLAGALFVVARNRKLDRAFAGLEVKGHQVGGVMQGWHGVFEGRTLDAWFRKGPTLELKK